MLVSLHVHHQVLLSPWEAEGGNSLALEILLDGNTKGDSLNWIGF